MKRISKLPLADGLIHLVFILVTLSMVIPLILVVSISMTDEESLIKEGYHLIPKLINFKAYDVILTAPMMLVKAYGVTIFVTLVGTILSLLVTTMVAYTMARQDYRYRRITTLYILFTMLFSGGLVPSYILITQYLHLKDTIWVMIIPALINGFHIMIMRGFLQKVPFEIIESAKMDGAGEWRIFFTMVIPLSTPALATLGLMGAFTFWNSWFLGLMYIDNRSLVPLQLLLVRIMSSIDFLSSSEMAQANVDIDPSDFPSLSARMAMAVMATGPMMFVFPFFQKYFVKGLTVGSLKG